MAKMRPMLTSLAFLLACCIQSTTGECDGDGDQRPVVETRNGPVRGCVRQSDSGARVNEFLGVPYAAPPVGDLRFKKTVEPKNFSGTFEADKMPPACPQFPGKPPWYDLEPGQSEDCLYLNIWVPDGLNFTNRRPMKLYLHGDDWFQGGSIRMGYYDGFGEALDTKDEEGNWQQDGIVVVTMNYRLGALGFLASSLTEEAPGNMGMYDIVQAINWIIYNIGRFGGSTGTQVRGVHQNLTLVGQGSGAIAASLIKTAIYRAGEIGKVVLNGASFLTLKAVDGVNEEGDAYVNNLRLTNMLAGSLGCPTPLRNNRNATIECLKGVEVSRLVRAAFCLSRGRGPPNVFLPQIKGPDQFFHGSNPYFMLHEYPFLVNRILTTFTGNEGSSLLTVSFPRVFGLFGEKDVPLSAANSKEMTRKLLKKFPETVVDELLGDLDSMPTTENRDKVAQAVGDAFVYCPVIYFAEELNRTKLKALPTEVYMLEKMVNPPYNPWAEWMGSVGFDNVQIDFLHPDRQLKVNNQTYMYTDAQSEQARISKEMLTSIMYSGRKFSIPQFTLEDPAYSILGSDGKLSDEKTSNFHGRNCDILRPFFSFKGMPSYE